MNIGIFIDDTGSPGLKVNSRYLTTDRKTWVAVILTELERIEAKEQLTECIKYIKDEFNADEFHFKDIYNGANQFKNIDLEIRLEIFKAFAEIFKTYKWPMIVQTFNNHNMYENKLIYENITKINEAVKIDNFNLKDNGDLALFYLLFKCKKYIEKNKNEYSLPVDFIIDEGRQKANTYQTTTLLEGIANNNKLYYAKSSEEILIQLADFAAFCLNRVQLIMANEKRNSLDNTFVKICEYADFNFINIPKEKVNLNKFSTDDFDYLHYQDKSEKKLLTKFEAERLAETIIKRKE